MMDALPHWLLGTGAVLVTIGLVGFAFRKNKSASDKDAAEAAPETKGK